MHKTPFVRNPRVILGALLTWLLAVAMTAAPAAAGTVYLALAVDIEIQGVSYSTQLRVTNTSDQARFFVTRFIPTFTDGTSGAGTQSSPIGVSPGHTFVFTSLSGAAEPGGMLEITGDDELVFSAVLLPQVGSQIGDGTEVPIIGSNELVRPGRLMTLQGLRRDPQHVSNLALLNLSHQPNQCNVDLYAANGVTLMNRVVLTLDPLSHNFWPDVLAIVGVDQAQEVRFHITCGGDAYAFGQTVNKAAADVTSILPAPSLQSTFAPPGVTVTPPAAGVCPSTSVCIDFPGTFHVATNDNRAFKAKIPMTLGRTFNRVDIEVTFTHGGWYKPLPDGAHNVLWLFSDNRFPDVTWGYVAARGPNRNFVYLVHTIGMGRSHARRRVDASLELFPGQTYKVHFSYDTGAGFVTTKWYSANGTLLATTTDQSTANRVFFEGNEGFEVWFGINGAGADVPSIGWQYRDARIHFSN
jgi:hypothetical protein